MYRKANKKYKSDIKLLHDLADEVGRLWFGENLRLQSSLSRRGRKVGRDVEICLIGCFTGGTQ
jgi:hypothetical protein